MDDLISQIDKETYPDLYWGMQLERAWWALRAYDDDSKGLRYLIQGKIQLAFVSRGAMGGHIDEFNKIERLAKARLAELGDPWIDLPQEDD